MAEGIDRLPSGAWRARYRDADGRQIGSAFDKQADAKAWRREQLDAVRNGRHVDPRGATRPFGPYAVERAGAWLKHRDTTRELVDRQLRNHVLEHPALGRKPIGKITRTDVEAWVLDRSLRLAPTTLRVVFQWVSKVFADAVRDRLVAASPCAGVELPPIVRGQVEPLPHAAIDALTGAMPERYRATVHLAAWTGLRQGEILGLRVPRVDLLGRDRDAHGRRSAPSVRVVEQLQTFQGGPRLVPPKTPRSTRRVPLRAATVQTLAAHLAAFPAGVEGFVFTSPTGRPVSRTQFNDAWRAGVARAGLPKGTHFHDLRHYYASCLIESGASVTAVSRLLGHASPTETLATYSHLWPDSDEAVLVALDRVAARAQDHVSQGSHGRG